MFKRLITLFKLGRKLAKSDVLSILSKFKKPPLLISVIFKLLSFSFTKKDVSFDNLTAVSYTHLTLPTICSV